MPAEDKTRAQLLAELEDLRTRLDQAGETLRAIRMGEVDTLVVAGPRGDQVFTLRGAEQPYRALIDQMNEGAVSLSGEGTILYCNRRLAEMLKAPLERVIGSDFGSYIEPAERETYATLLQGARRGRTAGEVRARAADGTSLPLRLSFNSLPEDSVAAFGVVATDLSDLKATDERLREARNELEARVAKRTASLTEAREELEASRLAALTMRDETIAAKTRTEETNAALQREIAQRERAEQALRDSEGLYRAIGESIDYGVWVCAPDGRNIYASESFLKLVGQTQEECSNFGWGDVLHPDDSARTISAWTECVRTGGTWDIEHRFRGVDGKWHDVLARGVPVKDERGEVICWAGINLDISRLKMAEERLRESERRLKMANEAAGIGTYEYDLLTGVIQWSPEVCEIMGVPYRDTRTPEEALSLVVSEDRPKVLSETERSMDPAGDGRVQLEFRIQKPDGAMRWIRWFGRTRFLDTPAGRVPVERVGGVIDITELRNAEEALRNKQERERLEAIVESLTEGIIIVDPQGYLVSMNPAALRLLEHEPSEVAGWNYRQAAEVLEVEDLNGRPVDPDDWPVGRALRGERFVGLEIQVQNRGTGRRWIGSYGGTPVRDAKGNLMLAVISIRDVTEERKAAEELCRANKALHQLTGQLLRVQDEEHKRIARELHDGTVQLLAAISINLGLLAKLRGVTDDPESRRLLKEARALVNRAQQELRTLSYLLHPPELDVFGLAMALRSWADGFSARTGIDVEVKLEDPGRVDADIETALFRIAQESLANVQQHSRSTTASICLAAVGGEIRLEVRDSGRGFPQGLLAGGHTGPERMGVGVMGMRERARQLGGSLEILSSGDGTTVRVVLPREKQT